MRATQIYCPLCVWYASLTLSFLGLWTTAAHSAFRPLGETRWAHHVATWEQGHNGIVLKRYVAHRALRFFGNRHECFRFSNVPLGNDLHNGFFVIWCFERHHVRDGCESFGIMVDTRLVVR